MSAGAIGRCRRPSLRVCTIEWRRRREATHPRTDVQAAGRLLALVVDERDDALVLGCQRVVHHFSRVGCMRDQSGVF